MAPDYLPSVASAPREEKRKLPSLVPPSHRPVASVVETPQVTAAATETHFGLPEPNLQRRSTIPIASIVTLVTAGARVQPYSQI